MTAIELRELPWPKISASARSCHEEGRAVAGRQRSAGIKDEERQEGVEVKATVVEMKKKDPCTEKGRKTAISSKDKKNHCPAPQDQPIKKRSKKVAKV